MWIRSCKLSEMSSYEKALFRLACVHWLLVAGLAMLFRGYLAFQLGSGDPQSFFFGVVTGTIFDLAVGIYSFLPWMIFLVLLPDFVVRRMGTARLLWIVVGIDTFIFLFGLVSEYFFYDEFKDRFNFIAVDYLVYTHEVLENIWQSYPLVPILSGLAVVAILISLVLARYAFREMDLRKGSWRAPLRGLVIYAGVFVLCFLTLTESRVLARANFAEELIGKNGLYALFAAYRNNEIKFDRFYTTTDGKRAASFVHTVLQGDHYKPAPGDIEVDDSIVRNIYEPAPFRKLNVVMVVMESLSARFMKAYGHPASLTPNLDRFAREGLFFNRIYATGTRTVRGLEAIVLSIPPTPGQSIVRRPAGVGIFNIGTPFREQGYRTSFIYGGRALFDNMGAFFAGNGFEVIDQSVFPSGEIEFANAWGVSDEDLFKQVIKVSDESAARKEKFFHVILNTSNHRPYTYPEGRVSIPSGKGRDGAVMYSDYAIGRLIEAARTRPWFDDTVFIFVADHNAAVAGQSGIDPNDYLVPMIFYSPKWIKPSVISHMGSQIDLAPTLLELLSASYQSRFFGMELQEDNPARAFVGTYQKVGYLDENSLTVLAPNRRVEKYTWDGKNAKLAGTEFYSLLPDNAGPALMSTVSFYKTASDWFSERLLDEKRRVSEDINKRN